MLTLKTSTLQDLVTYANALDTMFGMPRQGEPTYGIIFANLAAQANPLDPAAEWALDISAKHATWDALDADESVWPFPLALSQLDMLDEHYVGFPAGSSTWDCTYMHDPANPGWFPSGPIPV